MTGTCKESSKSIKEQALADNDTNDTLGLLNPLEMPGLGKFVVWRS